MNLLIDYGVLKSERHIWYFSDTFYIRRHISRWENSIPTHPSSCPPTYLFSYPSIRPSINRKSMCVTQQQHFICTINLFFPYVRTRLFHFLFEHFLITESFKIDILMDWGKLSCLVILFAIIIFLINGSRR